MKLSACLIVRDEEHYLDDCLRSIAAVVDEIVVVDTGSTDRSPEIAISHSAILVDEPWCNDFSYSRNIALDHASGDWILYFDADELLEAVPNDFSGLDDPELVAATVVFRAASQLTSYRETRLFRNRPDIRFRGVIHETVLPDIETICAAENARVIHTRARVEHRGYEGDLTHKHRRNHDMLLQAVKSDPERIYLWHALGECELGLGQANEAEMAWRHALEVIRMRQPQATDALIYTDLIGLHFAENGIELEDRDQLVRQAGQRHGSDPLIMWWTARHFMSAGQYTEARQKLHALLQPGADHTKGRAVSYDRRIFGAFSQALLGSCDMAERRYESAVERFGAALEGDPGNGELKLKLQYAQACAGRSSQGVRVIKLDAKDKVTSVAPVIRQEDE